MDVERERLEGYEEVVAALAEQPKPSKRELELLYLMADGLTDTEIALMRETGTQISHNPSSNAKLGNGIARIPEILAAGINVGIGSEDTDKARSATCGFGESWGQYTSSARTIPLAKAPTRADLGKSRDGWRGNDAQTDYLLLRAHSPTHLTTESPRAGSPSSRPGGFASTQ